MHMLVLIFGVQDIVSVCFVPAQTPCNTHSRSSLLHWLATASAIQRGQRSHYRGWTAASEMGSTGWARCFWCWQWEYNLYIPDPFCDPFCGHCLERLCEGQRPPWQPDARGRTAGLLGMIFRPMPPAPLPDSVCENIAEFLEPWYLP